MKTIKIVLTGGPCAGKTTVLKAICAHLKEKGIPYISVPETATEMIKNELKLKNYSKLYLFQTLILKKQLAKEQIADYYVKEFLNDNELCVIIYDRGIIDNKAYLPNKDDFSKMIAENNLTEIEVLDSYDLVIDMISTAVCKKDAYNLENEARSESIEEAIAIDKKTSEAWALHRNLKIINSSVPLVEETQIVIDYIDEIISGQCTHEQRKFLLDDNSSNYQIYNKENSEKINITEFHLGINDDNKHHVISKREFNNQVSYIYSIYEENGNSKKIYYDKPISQEEYFNLILNNDIISRKERQEIHFVENKQKYVICFHEGYTTLELEENTLNDKLIIPNNLKIKNEIIAYKSDTKTRKKVK